MIVIRLGSPAVFRRIEAACSPPPLSLFVGEQRTHDRELLGYLSKMLMSISIILGERYR